MSRNGHGIDEAGEPADAVVLLHYFGGSSRTWREVARRLGADVRVVAIDLRGFGHSFRALTPGAGYAVEDYAGDVAEVVRSAGLRRYALVGHSMGGKIALALAARRPERLTGLVLIAPSPPTPEPMTDAERSRMLRGYGSAVAAGDTLDRIAATPLEAGPRRRAIEDWLASTPAAWHAWLEQGSRQDISPLVPRIDVPAVVVAGGADPLFPAALLHKEVVARLPRARLQVVPGAGHLLPLEAPDEIARIIREQVRTCD